MIVCTNCWVTPLSVLAQTAWRFSDCPFLASYGKPTAKAARSRVKQQGSEVDRNDKAHCYGDCLDTQGFLTLRSYVMAWDMRRQEKGGRVKWAYLTGYRTLRDRQLHTVFTPCALSCRYLTALMTVFTPGSYMIKCWYIFIA